MACLVYVVSDSVMCVRRLCLSVSLDMYTSVSRIVRESQSERLTCSQSSPVGHATVYVFSIHNFKVYVFSIHNFKVYVFSIHNSEVKFIYEG